MYRLALIALATFVLSLGCQKRQTADDDDETTATAPATGDAKGDPTAPKPKRKRSKGSRAYGASADELKALWEDILEAAQKDDRGRVHDLLAPLVMSEAELRTLLGDETGRRLWPRYRTMTETLVNRGAVELVAQVYDRKLDDVQVIAIDPKTASSEDRAILDAVKEPIQLYSVRVKKKADDRGLRYDFFFYRDGKWRTGNQLGKILAEQGPAAPPPSTTTKRDGGT
jgi:hypothetical protein